MSPSYTTAVSFSSLLWHFFFKGTYIPLGTNSGWLTAIFFFSSVVKPAFCVVSATLNVVGTAILGIHFPVASWIWYATALALSIGEPPPIEIRTSAPEALTSSVASRIARIGLKMFQFQNGGERDLEKLTHADQSC